MVDTRLPFDSDELFYEKRTFKNYFCGLGWWQPMSRLKLAAVNIKNTTSKIKRTIFNGIPALETSEANSKKSIASLANLLEQHESLLQLDAKVMPLTSQFPDLMSRVQVKVSGEIEMKVGIISNHLDTIKEQLDLAYKTRCDVLNLCTKYKSDFSQPALTTGQPTVPPVSVMLGWVDEVERLLREIYCSRQFYLENLLDKTVVNSDNLSTVWFEGVPPLMNVIKDCQEQTKYFLEDKI